MPAHLNASESGHTGINPQPAGRMFCQIVLLVQVLGTTALSLVCAHPTVHEPKHAGAVGDAGIGVQHDPHSGCGPSRSQELPCTGEPGGC